MIFTRASIRVFLFLLVITYSHFGSSQHLTISTSGEGSGGTITSGTNWSINTSTHDLTVGSSGSAHIHPNVITTYLGNTGRLAIILPWQGGTERNVIINSTISYGASRNATLVIYSANHIQIASGISIQSTNFPLNLALNSRYNVNYSVNLGIPDYGKIAFTNNTITTRGGHFWVGGGGTSSTLSQFANTFWIGGEASVTWGHGETGLQVSGTTITTGGGHVSMSGWAFPSGTAGLTSYGLSMSNSSINSGTGNITLTGQINGTYTNGIGLALWPDGTGPVNLTTTSGNITLTGKGYDINTVTAGGGWRNGLILEGGSSAVTLSTQSGNITLDGQANFNYQVNDKEGLHIYSPTTDRVRVISRTGNITLKGSNTQEDDGQYCNGIIFRASDVSNAIRIGYDGINAYSGNILIESNSIVQNSNNAGSGSLAIQSTGSLTIQPKDDVFTYLRAGASGALTFDNDWNFGTDLSGFTFGKEYVSSTPLDLSYAGALSTKGPITFHTKNFTINGNITASTASAITINATESFNREAGTNRYTVSSAGGNITIHADKDASGGGVLNLGYLTMDPGAGNITLRGETFNWAIASSTDKPYLNGTGSVTIEPSDAAFGQELQTTWLNLDQDGNGMGGLTLGKSTNNQNITHNFGALSVAGPVNLYGGALTISQNLTTTTSAGDILLQGATVSGSGNLSVAAGRTATMNVSSASSYAGIISGSGSGLTKQGVGELSLTNTHTYTGATTISEGNLLMGSGGVLATASAVSVASSSKLILAPNNNSTFGSNVTGAGGLEIKGISGTVRNTFITTSPTLLVSNISVLEALSRISGGYMNSPSSQIATGFCGAYQKSYNATNNTATIQFQTANSNGVNVVIVELAVINTTDVSIKGISAGFVSNSGGTLLGQDNSNYSSTRTIATSYGSNPYTLDGSLGITQVYLSGKVNFTGILTYTGATTLSNTVNSSSVNPRYSTTSRGTLEIIDESSSLPSGSAVTNNGLIILKRATAPLTITNDLIGTEEIIQLGAAVTFTGTNTYTGNTTIAQDKSLSVGSGGTSGSMTSNIINYGSLTFNRSDASTYVGVISGTGTVTKSGSGALTMTGLNTYTGATTINAGSLVLQRDVPATSSSGFSGAGTLVIQPNSNSFTSALTYPITGFTVSSSIGGLTLGKTTNTSAITFNGATQTGGTLTAYGGAITVSSALTAAGDILLDGDPGSFLTQNTVGVTVNAALTSSNNGNITLIGRGGSGSSQSTNFGVYVTQQVEAGGSGMVTVTGTGGLSSNGASSSSHGVNLDGANAWIKSNGGDVSVTGTGGGASSGSYSQGIAMINSSRISAGGSGTVTLSGTGGVNTAIGLRGVVMASSSSVFSAGGAINITGNAGANGSDNSDGFSIDNATIGSNTSGAITIVGTGGGGTGSEAISLSTANTIGGASHAGNITFRGNTFSISGTNNVTTTGQLTIEPTGTSFASALTYPISNLTIAGTVSGLTLGKSTNTANVTVGAITSIAGPVTIYGGILAINENLSSSTGSAISLYGNTLTFSSGKTVSSTGELLVAPQTASNTIGVAGASGDLQVTTTNLSTNFTNGFSNITIGSDNQSGMITANAFTLQDNITFKSSNFALGGIVSTGNNDITLDSRISYVGSHSSTKYIQTNGTGKLKRSIANGTQFEFPVGLSAYNRVQIRNNNSTPDIFSINVLDEVYSSYDQNTGAATGTVMTGPRIKRTWNIGKANPNTGSGIRFEFFWNSGEESSPAPTSTALYHYNAGVWTRQTGATTRGSGSLTYDSYTGTFSPFAIGDVATSLPVTWLTFTATKQPTAVDLNWSTASEQNTKDFEVQYSTNTQDWSALGTLIAAGNSASARNYTFTHLSPLKGNAYNYYRILQRDLDGKFSYSKIVSIIYNEPGADIVIYPNPVKDVINIYLAESQQVNLVNMSGVSVWKGQLTAGRNQLPVTHLPKGIYLLVTNYGTQRIVIQ